MPTEGGGRLLATIRVLAATLLVSAGLASAEAEPAMGIIGKDDRELLDPVAWPWLAIGRVNRTSGGFCTGALVAPDLVLTARHCLIDHRTGLRVKPDTV